MDGIEILKITEITKVPDFIVIGLIISLIAGLIVVFITQNKYFNHPIIEAFIVVTVTVAMIGFMFAAVFARVNTGEYKYEIRVDKNVSLNEFYDKYEVLKRYDYSDVYIVKERITK